MIPGIGDSFRVNGEAVIVDPALEAAPAPGGDPQGNPDAERAAGELQLDQGAVVGVELHELRDGHADLRGELGTTALPQRPMEWLTSTARMPKPMPAV